MDKKWIEQQLTSYLTRFLLTLLYGACAAGAAYNAQQQNTATTIAAGAATLLVFALEKGISWYAQRRKEKVAMVATGAVETLTRSISVADPVVGKAIASDVQARTAGTEQGDLIHETITNARTSVRPNST